MCSVALGVLYAVHMRLLSSVVCPAHTSFPHLKRQDLGGIIEHKMCILVFSTILCETSHSEKNRARYDQKCVLVFM